MIQRHSDAKYLNEICNHPSVLPWLIIPGIESIDVSQFASDPNNYILMTDGGGCWLHKRLQHVYEGHVLFIEGKRSKLAYRATKEALEYMFLGTDCLEIYLRIPGENKGAIRWAEGMGFQFDYVRIAWPSDNGLKPFHYFSLNFEGWLRTLKEDEDNKRLRVAQEMIARGHSDKAISLYNKWAFLVGQRPMQG